jgi:hypothetical protein
MASVYETVGSFTVTRLRGVDASYLSGAVRPTGVLPDPIAVATGPNDLAGPVAGGLLTGETWAVGVSIGAYPDIAWVLVCPNYIFKRKDTATGIVSNYFFPIGSPTSSGAYQGAPRGVGNNIESLEIANAGTYQHADVPKDVVGTSSGCWLPIDPAQTTSGFQACFNTLVQATHQALDFALDLRQLTYLGFPVNLWGTGALWRPTAFRGA